MAQIVAATYNEHKLNEYRELLKDQKVEVVGLNAYKKLPEIKEDGATFEENASIKALTANKYCDIPAFADDSGLEVEALNGAPGIMSARYADTDSERIARILGELGDNRNRQAKFVCVIAIALNGEVIETFRGEVHGVITKEPRGNNGFGYDPIFIPDGYDKTFGELDAEIKNKISHRALAFQKAMEFIEDEMSVLDDDFS
jgi:XTP/dITP diphosphohydrolase